MELIGWHNPRIQFSDIPIWMRIYEQIMCSEYDWKSTDIGKHPKRKKKVLIWGEGKPTVVFESKTDASKRFKVSENTLRKWIHNGEQHDGYYFRHIEYEEEDRLDEEGEEIWDVRN